MDKCSSPREKFRSIFSVPVTITDKTSTRCYAEAVSDRELALPGSAVTGFQFGSSFSGDEFLAPSYAGYAHFGTDATNPLPPSSTVGVNLLPLMANPSFSVGATGFTRPLAAGTYTFLIQQGDPATTSYQFDMTVRSVSVPEPGFSLCLLGMGGLAILALRRRLGYVDRRIR